METSGLRENEEIVQSLRIAIRDGGIGLRHVPALLKRIIREDRWRERIASATGKVTRFESFEAFVETPPLDGLGADLRLLERICRDDKEALDLLDQAVQRPAHRPQAVSHDNVMTYEAEQGNATSYALRRLRKDRSDLHARVLSGELSPHGAMVEAGFRPRTIQVPCDPERAAQTLARHFQDAELSQLVAALVQCGDGDERQQRS